MAIHLHITKVEARRTIFIFLIVILAVEGLAAMRLFITSKDVVAGGLVVTSWCRDWLRALIEKLA
jgi:hypothetical protein